MLIRIKESYKVRKESKKYEKLLKYYDRPKLSNRLKRVGIHVILIIIFMLYNHYCVNMLYVMSWNSKVNEFQISESKFRKFHVGGEYIRELNMNLEKEKSNARLSKKFFIGNFIKKTKYTSYEYFTMTMILNDYDSLDYRVVNKVYLNRLLENYSLNTEFIRLNGYYISILSDIETLPVDYYKERSPYYNYSDTWYANRSYGGDRKHEGTDFIPYNNLAGKYQVRSMTDGIIEQIGWLEQGGYRIGIRSKNGGYYYYAHLDSWIDGLKIGDMVYASELIGYMGDSGYGVEGTRGKFVVHLHLGIYVNGLKGEMSVNPYYIIKYLELFL